MQVLTIRRKLHQCSWHGSSGHWVCSKLPLRVLDLCAAPGGKSTLLRTVLHPDSFLLANEVVGSRVNLLEETLSKWGIPGYAISQSDPSKFGKLPGLFDLVVVDAPCSGEGMFRKDPQALAHWSPANVESCALRQSRILDDVWPALSPGGILIYSTCTFNTAENEARVAAFRQKSGAEEVRLELPFPEIVAADDRAGTAAFRFYPHLLQGEGFFVAVLRKAGTGRRAEPKARPLPVIDNPGIDHQLAYPLDSRGNVFAARPKDLALLAMLSQQLNLIVPGQPVGSFIQGKFKPGHGLALLANSAYNIPEEALDLEEALRFLQRDDVYKTVGHQGLVKVLFEGFALGFAKAGNGRLVSQYPKHWRVRQGKASDYIRLVHCT
jgi:NOL1/NOP2/fmu family ribosome biogenesis protein